MINRREFLCGAAAATISVTAGVETTHSEESESMKSHDQSSQKERPPNIVWIWGDNIGYGDLGCYGNERVSTPAVDKLAAEGARFTKFYIAHTVCSPSRAALLTGRRPWRTGIIDVLRPDGPSGIPDDEVTLAELLRDRGYATAAIGKWHLGDRPEFLPCRHGFDHYFGLPYSMDMLPTILYRDNEIVDRLPGDKVRDVTIRLTDAAIDFVAANKDKPFFLYFSHTLPHPPLNLPENARTEERTLYEDAMGHLDQQTGRLLDALERLGLADNTLVMFSSDNGPMAQGGSAGNLRGRIRDAYEGGIRVPLIARWPGHIPGGRVVHTPAIAYDVFPTLVELAGANLPEDRLYDGQSILPVLKGDGSFERDKPFAWVYRERVSAVFDGRWKLHLAHRDKPLDPPELYDIDEDPRESKSLADNHPDVVERLRGFAESIEDELPQVWSLHYPVRDPAKRDSGVRRE